MTHGQQQRRYGLWAIAALILLIVIMGLATSHGSSAAVSKPVPHAHPIVAGQHGRGG